MINGYEIFSLASKLLIFIVCADSNIQFKILRRF